MAFLLCWIPRMLILLLTSFFLLLGMDAFFVPAPLWRQLLQYCINILPAVFLMGTLFISLRTTRTASIILVLLSIIGMLYFKTYLHIIAFLIVTGMPLIASMILACAPEDNDGTSLQTGNGTQLASHA
ncbi:hypothetical protein GX553_01825 [Candidatus Peribacteria bacterium]|nr:hypothetical protein [Candidatus Peribacteria bacterium]